MQKNSYRQYSLSKSNNNTENSLNDVLFTTTIFILIRLFQPTLSFNPPWHNKEHIKNKCFSDYWTIVKETYFLYSGYIILFINKYVTINYDSLY